jgi:predicted nucleotidyltransferase
MQQFLIGGVREAVEASAKIDIQGAKDLYEQYESSLIALNQRAAPEVREALITAFSRLHGLGIVSDERLSELGITIPALAGPFSKNLASMNEKMASIERAISTIETDPSLSPYIYPVALIYGSRLKGYNSANSDMDIAVFIKPGTAADNGHQLRTALAKTFSAQNITGEIVEFWLEERAEELAVRDLETPDALQGDSSWTHVLFGGAWEGDSETIKTLREKLLVPYFRPTDTILTGQPAHARHLESLERDTLQYRLMHKGYAKFFPSYGGIHTAHASQIDGQSTFWDSGYRQTALKLYANRVFLPRLSR